MCFVYRSLEISATLYKSFYTIRFGDLIHTQLRNTRKILIRFIYDICVSIVFVHLLLVSCKFMLAKGDRKQSRSSFVYMQVVHHAFLSDHYRVKCVERTGDVKKNK